MSVYPGDFMTAAEARIGTDNTIKIMEDIKRLEQRNNIKNQVYDAINMRKYSITFMPVLSEEDFLYFTGLGFKIEQPKVFIPMGSVSDHHRGAWTPGTISW